ncbi:MAG: GerMN domain-containing protein, partial [Candidatus Poribacteria bacterium]
NAEVVRESRYTRGVSKLLRLRIDDGTAYPDFSNEIHAYGGGGMPSALISAQIVKTLRQFPEIGSVVISVEGRTANVLQP